MQVDSFSSLAGKMGSDFHPSTTAISYPRLPENAHPDSVTSTVDSTDTCSLASDEATENVIDKSVVQELEIADPKANDCDAQQGNGINRKCFAYDIPLPEETGAWIPLSVPPSGHGGYDVEFFPEDNNSLSSNTYDLTAWRVLIEAMAFLCGAHKQKNRLKRSMKAGFHEHLAALTYRRHEEDSCDPIASLLIDRMGDNVKTMSEVLAAEPPQWLPDSYSAVCMQCRTYFHPIFFLRHHCRFCGRIFCGSCTSQKALLPVKFRERNPQRVCDSCHERLASVQGILFEQVSNAAQQATHDVTDLTCLRAWINSPIGFSLEDEIFKATNTLRSFMEIGTSKPERAIPDSILKGAKGFAILTVIKVGMMVTYKVGTGLVIGMRPDGSWSAPSAIISSGMGWGPQAGGEITDFIIILRNKAALKAFSGRIHLSLGAGVSVAAGPLGRSFEADVRAGDGGAAACYTYSLSKGVFVGCSLEGNVVMTRVGTNIQFYGDTVISAAEILMGSVKQPKAAAPLYSALSDLYRRVRARYC
ncbi:hypothetical protein KP509_20G075200 [Ceratopteris richardii]|uniref:FYVE-type domain-containing protein n=1 Tax=Ceratopteris richardii TaxID=49495 RepID=A0A8T2SIK5_CERRI|nr:hypothetical protein KP509_20G075200 [Ceratopteris richardii]